MGPGVSQRDACAGRPLLIASLCFRHADGSGGWKPGFVFSPRHDIAPLLCLFTSLIRAAEIVWPQSLSYLGGAESWGGGGYWFTSKIPAGCKNLVAANKKKCSALLDRRLTQSWTLLISFTRTHTYKHTLETAPAELIKSMWCFAAKGFFLCVCLCVIYSPRNLPRCIIYIPAIKVTDDDVNVSEKGISKR